MVISLSFQIFPPKREAPAESQRPEGEGANIDWRLVPYHGKCKRIQSGIEFIYLFIYICINRGPHARGIGILALVNSLQQKLIWLRKQTWNGIYSFFFQKEI